jgi:DNA-binding transcriptional LysR family regulator
MSITPLRLRHAASLAEHASFRRAAATLRISQPALTKSIQALEAALGVQLFERRRDGVLPTEFGRLVLEHTRGMVLAESELLRQIHLVAGLETGSLNVAFGPLPGTMSVYPAAGALLAEHPNLRISLQSASWREVIHAVVEKKVDLGIAEISGAMHDDSLQTALIGQHRVHFLCRAGHPILRERRITLTQLLEYPWATTRLPPRMAKAFPPAIKRAGYIDTLSGDFVPAIDLWAPLNLSALIAKSEVLALGPLTLVEHELEKGSVVIVLTEGLNLHGGYGFVYLKSRPLSPAARAYMTEIRAHEQLLVKNEARLEKLYRHTQRRTHT